MDFQALNKDIKREFKEEWEGTSVVSLKDQLVYAFKGMVSQENSCENRLFKLRKNTLPILNCKGRMRCASFSRHQSSK